MPDRMESVEASSAHPPQISVIVGAYRREQYVKEAVRSVLDQTLGRGEIEVVVIKDFTSGPIDEYLARNGVTSILDPSPRIGPWLMRAVRETRAPLVAFLDDDDLFEPDRLRHVVEEFREHPDVGYYRNRVSVIDPQGSPIRTNAWATNEVDAVLDGTGPLHVPNGSKPAALSTIRRTYSFFNTSTIVIRRELLTPQLAVRFEEYQNPDPFLFAAGLLSPFGLYLDDRRLTRYRHHATNVTGAVGSLRHGLEDSRRLARWCRDSGWPDYAGWLDERSTEIEKRLLVGTITASIESGDPRWMVAAAARAYLGFLHKQPGVRNPDWETWAAAVYALTYLVSPLAARRALRLRVARRSRERVGGAGAGAEGNGAARI